MKFYDFTQRLKMEIDREYFINLNKPLVLDGPMGTLLIERGIDLGSRLWSALALLNNPDEVLKIHRDYINAGADIITTNTFRTNPFAVKNSETQTTSEELVKIAVNLARKAIENSSRKILIAGSNAPADDCYLKKRLISLDELKENHYQHIKSLIQAGVDFILNETFGNTEEIEIVCQICNEFNFPFAVSVLIDHDLKTFFGQDLVETVQMIYTYNPLFISLNCSRPENILKAIDLISEFYPLGVYPNLGSINSFATGKLIRDYSIVNLIDFTKVLTNKGVRVIGVCCGGNPDDIKVIRQTVDSL